MSEKRRYRCAVYTRKSHEEGLDQDFNSLDAQRESCEAYILSQAGLGWELSNKFYDDGGISGGHLKRPGLQALLEDIRAGQIDIVVVYKVDRLTRSITDFGKLVETFDAQDVSFVSVTQAFNTTNSMGRLTLNVLLSFAQFEREVTAERIRDKIAGSKQKGMWMGGRVPFGYRNENKQLFVDREDANIVKLMFDLYVSHQNTNLVKEALDRQHIVSKRRLNKAGKQTGGLPFTTGNIRNILSNPIYAGNIRHKDKVYPGNHEAIVSPAKWDEVQNILSSKRTGRTHRINTQSPALLKGVIFDEDGNRLIAHHVNKKGQRYYYYVTKQSNNNVNEAATKNTGTGSNNLPVRLPMQMIEAAVKGLLIEALTSNDKLFRILQLQNADAETLQKISVSASHFAEVIRGMGHDQLRTLYPELINSIIVHKDRLEVNLHASFLSEQLSVDCLNNGCSNEKAPQITKQMKIRRRGQELKLIIGGSEPKPKKLDTSLIKLIAKAHLLKHELQSGEVTSIKEFAEKYSLDHGDAKNLVPLSYLAPSIVETIHGGTQSSELNASRLKAIVNSLPIRWNEQKQILGFAT